MSCEATNLPEHFCHSPAENIPLHGLRGLQDGGAEIVGVSSGVLAVISGLICMQSYSSSSLLSFFFLFSGFPHFLFD